MLSSHEIDHHIDRLEDMARDILEDDPTLTNGEAWEQACEDLDAHLMDLAESYFDRD